MEKDDMGNRMALGITTILTIMFLLGSLNGNLPRVSYPKALDWYLLVSFSFVFLSLMECMVVFLFASKAKQDETQIKYKVSVRSLISAGPGRGGGGGVGERITWFPGGKEERSVINRCQQGIRGDYNITFLSQ